MLAEVASPSPLSCSDNLYASARMTTLSLSAIALISLAISFPSDLNSSAKRCLSVLILS